MLGCTLAIALVAGCVRVPPVDSSTPRVSQLPSKTLPPAGELVTVPGAASKFATGRRLPSGLHVTIAEIGPGDVYYDERERFVGTACITMRVQRSVDRYYQGTLQCFGVPYRFAYVGLAASTSPVTGGRIIQ